MCRWIESPIYGKTHVKSGSPLMRQWWGRRELMTGWWELDGSGANSMPVSRTCLHSVAGAYSLLLFWFQRHPMGEEEKQRGRGEERWVDDSDIGVEEGIYDPSGWGGEHHQWRYIGGQKGRIWSSLSLLAAVPTGHSQQLATHVFFGASLSLSLSTAATPWSQLSQGCRARTSPRLWVVHPLLYRHPKERGHDSVLL